MKIDGKEILEKLSVGRKNDREKTSMYLSKAIYEAFKKACGDVPTSQVVEELMQQFVDSLKRK
jgi:hypothetical protein